MPRIAASCADADFASGGRTVRARLCLPAGASSTHRVPAVVVLHGCGGFGTLDQLLARQLPANGIASEYVDYFGLTPPPSRRKASAMRTVPLPARSRPGCGSRAMQHKRSRARRPSTHIASERSAGRSAAEYRS
jgi:dienelactone hydrolase